MGFQVHLRFCFPPFSLPLLLTQSSSLRGEDAHGTSLPGQDRTVCVRPPRRVCEVPPLPRVTEELEIKEDGTGNFKFPLPEVAGDAEVAAGSFREPRCRAEDKPRIAPEEEVGPPPRTRGDAGVPAAGSVPTRPPQTTCQPQPGGSPALQNHRGEGGRREQTTPALPSINTRISLNTSGYQTPLCSGKRDAKSHKRVTLLNEQKKSRGPLGSPAFLRLEE